MNLDEKNSSTEVFHQSWRDDLLCNSDGENDVINEFPREEFLRIHRLHKEKESLVLEGKKSILLKTINRPKIAKRAYSPMPFEFQDVTSYSKNLSLLKKIRKNVS